MNRSPNGARPGPDEGMPDEGLPAPDQGRLRCASCGAFLDGDPDDDPTGDAGRPICGECARERDFDVDVMLMDEDEQ